MTHLQLVDYCLAAHTGLILVIVVPFLRWVFYDEVLRRRLPAVNKTIRSLSKSLANDLARALRPLLGKNSQLDELGVAESVIIFSERTADVLSSEAFREAIQDFVGQKCASMVDLKALLAVKHRIRFWTVVRSILLFMLFVLEILLVVRLGLDKFGLGSLPDTTIPLLFVPPGVLLAALLISLAVLIASGGSAGHLEDKYDREAV